MLHPEGEKGGGSERKPGVALSVRLLFVKHPSGDEFSAYFSDGIFSHFERIRDFRSRPSGMVKEMLHEARHDVRFSHIGFPYGVSGRYSISQEYHKNTDQVNHLV
jgi:hypothetical protein